LGPNKTGTTCNKYTHFSIEFSIKWQIFLKNQIWQMKGWVSTIKKNA
jgi:hypothetical protein